MTLSYYKHYSTPMLTTTITMAHHPIPYASNFSSLPASVVPTAMLIDSFFSNTLVTNKRTKEMTRSSDSIISLPFQQHPCFPPLIAASPFCAAHKGRLIDSSVVSTSTLLVCFHIWLSIQFSSLFNQLSFF